MKFTVTDFCNKLEFVCEYDSWNKLVQNELLLIIAISQNYLGKDTLQSTDLILLVCFAWAQHMRNWYLSVFSVSYINKI